MVHHDDPNNQNARAPVNVHFTAGLPDRERRQIVQWLDDLPSIQYEIGEKLIYEGMPAIGVHLIYRGQVKVIQSGDTHKELILKIVCPGELLGEESMWGMGKHTSSAQALALVEAKFIKQEQFNELISQYPALVQRLTKKLALEVKAMQKRLLEASFFNTEEKVARFLLAVAEKIGQPNEQGQTQFELLRADLAGLAGISVETAIRTLKQFEEQGWVRINYHTLTLLEPGQLASVALPMEVDVLEHVL